MSKEELIKEFNNTKFICGVEISREQQCALKYAALRLKELNENKDQQIAELQAKLNEYEIKFKKHTDATANAQIKMYDEQLKNKDLQARVAELENMNNKLCQGIYWGNGEQFCDRVKRLEKEIKQLQYQLQAQPKQIVEEIRGKAYDCYKEWGVFDNYDLDSILDNLLKKYLEGDNESNYDKH